MLHLKDCSQVFRDVAELPVENDGIVPQNRPRPFPSTFFYIMYVILPFGSM
jgi:hypothetical protein